MARAIDFCRFFPSLTSSPSVYGGEDVNFPSSRPFSDRSFDIVIGNTKSCFKGIGKRVVRAFVLKFPIGGLNAVQLIIERVD
jgi:hypothetical protein